MAGAVDYLHSDCEPSVVHCDLKPSNVLLDAGMCAKVADFGLARLLLNEASVQDSVTSTHRIKGSIGYTPPEYGFGGKPSTQGDVYSYGVMLLELVTGKSPTDESFVGGLSLEKWVRAAFPNRTAEVIDTELDVTNVIRSGACTISPEKQLMCLVSMIQIALCCVLESPETRSSMRDVLHQLESIKEALVKKPQIVV
uniref:non-specific serine/threonine protein kinase n=1 Tax=Ananas comosus var. bracteatus TaxID=296719 RepID=A0A6V7QN82_ANACO|nr:unnamed protein product [Ananas comosus var. bracteatus]